MGRLVSRVCDHYGEEARRNPDAGPPSTASAASAAPCCVRHHERGADIEIVAINDVADAATLAALLARDSVYGRFPGPWRSARRRHRRRRPRDPGASEPDPAELPWGELGVDVVIESTGRFRTRAGPPRTSRPARAR